MREMIGCTPMAHCNNVWGLWVRVIFLWDVLMMFHGFCPLWDLVMRFDAFWPYSHYPRLFLTSRGLGVGGLLFLSTTTPYATWCFVLHISRMRFRSGMLVLFVGRCELSFFESSCFLLHNLLMRCVMLFGPPRDLLVRVHALCCLWDVRLSFHACWPQGELLVRCHAF